MARRYFGTDGIRAEAGTYPLNELGAYRIGKSIGQYFSQNSDQKSPYIVLGRDPRESSPMLEKAIVKGLSEAGVHVQLIGVIPTPGLMYLAGETDAIAGVMITASHNPYTDNGVKVVSGDGKKLPDEIEEAIDQLLVAQIEADEPAGDENIVLVDETLNDPQTIEVLHQQYEDFLYASAGGMRLDGMKLAVDTANGATSGYAQRLFTKLGAEVTAMSDQPDGKNINVECGATHTEAMQNKVKELGLDAGVAFDGDGDRLMMSDGQGRQLSGDNVMYILAVATDQKAVVATAMSNMGLENALGEQGIELLRADVGDRYVLEMLGDKGYTLGGEQSGHIIMLDQAKTGDGMLAAVQVLKHVKASGKSLAEWGEEVTVLPQKIVNIRVSDKSLISRPEIQQFLADQQIKFGTSGRLNIRPSGTEPLIRVMVESANAEEQAQAIADELSKLWNSLS